MSDAGKVHTKPWFISEQYS